MKGVGLEMMPYATIEEAWSASTPPVRYPAQGDAFDVGRHDGDRPDSNFCRPEVALESAYPAADAERGAEYQRMYGSRSTETLNSHAARDPGCVGSPADAGARDAPEQMYARAVEGATWPHTRTPPSSDPYDRRSDHRRAGKGNAGECARSGAPPPEHAGATAASERARLYDTLVFVLFGLLLVLVMHEFAALGETVGRNRAFAAAAARAASYARFAPGGAPCA